MLPHGFSTNGKLGCPGQGQAGEAIIPFMKYAMVSLSCLGVVVPAFNPRTEKEAEPGGFLSLCQARTARATQKTFPV